MPRPLRWLAPCAIAALLLAPAARAGSPRQIRIALSPGVTLERLLEAGLDVVSAKPGASVDVLEWPGDGATLAALGASFTVVDDDPGLHEAQRARAELALQPAPVRRQVWSAARPDGRFRVESYPPAGSGSLGGFWTLAEVKMKLDDLVASDTEDLVADAIDTLGYSLQGRPIWGLRIAKAVTGPDTRPVVFYSALTHAREPGGMQALFNFIDDILAHYDSDPVARYLLENRQIYICPVVNPDGYAFNEQIYDTTASHAFGLWRKNLRDNNNNHVTDGNDGVDINRNYGYKWGLNTQGSSTTMSADDYRGPAAWSEPETQIQRDAFAALQPVCGFPFHTYSDLFVHPWGWTTTGTPDSAKFQTWSDEFAITNGFAAGPAMRILYPVNGEFSDWTYGDTLLKPRAYTWTPELGGPNDGFWPPPSRMPAISGSVLRPCYQVAGIAGPWVRAQSSTVLEGYLSAGQTAHLVVHARNIGQTGTAGPGLQAKLTALDPAVGADPAPVAYPTLGSFQDADPSTGQSFTIGAADSITPGRLVRFRVEWTDARGLCCRDTVELVVGTPTVTLVDPCQSLGNWTLVAGQWGVRSNDPAHPDAYIADSPSGLYPNNYTGQLKLTTPLDLSAGVHAWAFFEDRWGFEPDYDAGLIEASPDGTNWTALPGNGAVTSVSSDVAGAGHSIFDGTRWLWRQDRIDLSSFAGGSAATAVRLRWRSLSDSGLDLDGMNFDSLRVYVYDPTAQPVPTAVAAGPRPGRLEFSPPEPNPAGDRAAFAFRTPEAGALTLEVIDVQGRVRWTRRESIASGADGGPYAASFRWGWDLRDDAGRRVEPGLYFARLRTASHSATQRLVVVR
ncbi:MAG TPA: M14 family zinc carboxypeptidase [Candidatus Acidoferrales bacterium]|nr:M14 family zinc carboxypeptidase [Candidatus Acidoferrales bacterium]